MEVLQSYLVVCVCVCAGVCVCVRARARVCVCLNLCLVALSRLIYSVVFDILLHLAPSISLLFTLLVFDAAFYRFLWQKD
jgi:hypothetical protein